MSEPGEFREEGETGVKVQERWAPEGHGDSSYHLWGLQRKSSGSGNESEGLPQGGDWAEDRLQGTVAGHGDRLGHVPNHMQA